jgi:hypothetical protein
MEHFDPLPPLTFEITGFVNSDPVSVVHGSPKLSTTASSTSSAGRYTVTVEAGSLAADNYDFQLADGQVTVNPKVLDARVRYGSRSISLFGLKRDLPFTTISALDLVFSDPVKVNLDQLTLTGVNVPSYRFGGLSYNPSSNDATFRLPTALGVDRLMMAISGETFAADSTITVKPFAVKFAVLPGDFNGDGGVNLQDALLVQSEMLGKGDSSLIGWADLDGDGFVDANDVTAVRKRIGSKL